MAKVFVSLAFLKFGGVRVDLSHHGAPLCHLNKLVTCMEGCLDTISNRTHRVCYSKMRTITGSPLRQADLEKKSDVVYFVKSS